MQVIGSQTASIQRISIELRPWMRNFDRLIAGSNLFRPVKNRVHPLSRAPPVVASVTGGAVDSTCEFENKLVSGTATQQYPLALPHHGDPAHYRTEESGPSP